MVGAVNLLRGSVLVLSLMTVLLVSVRESNGDMRKPLSDADIDRIAEQWDEDEEEDEDDPAVRMRKAHEQPPSIDPSAFAGDPRKMMAAQKKGKTAMVFAAMNTDKIRTKPEMEEITTRWMSMLMNNALEVKAYPIEETKILLVIEDGSRYPELEEFLTSQPEVDFVEVDQQKTYGKHSWSKRHPKKVKKLEEEQKKKNELKSKKVKERQAREEELKKKGADPFKENLKKTPVSGGGDSSAKKKLKKKKKNLKKKNKAQKAKEDL